MSIKKITVKILIFFPQKNYVAYKKHKAQFFFRLFDLGAIPSIGGEKLDYGELDIRSHAPKFDLSSSTARKKGNLSDIEEIYASGGVKYKGGLAYDSVLGGVSSSA